MVRVVSDFVDAFDSMTEPVTIALIGGVVSVLLALVTAAMTILNTIVIRRTEKQVVMLEKNTNSIKDALVKVTGEAEFAKGLKTGIETVVQVQQPQGPITKTATTTTHQVDRIEQTGEDTNDRVQKVEKRVLKVEDDVKS